MKYFHVGVDGPRNPQAVREALETAGFAVQDIVETTHEHSGIIMTARMAGYTWDSQTGNNNCNGSCAEEGGPPHRKLAELSDEQHGNFVTRALDFMNSCRGDMEMDLEGLARLGRPVRTHDCAQGL